MVDQWILATSFFEGRLYDRFPGKSFCELEERMKKLIIAIVILTFAFSVLFIGCGKKEEPKPVIKKPVVKATPKPVATPAPTPKPIQPKKDNKSDAKGFKAPKEKTIKKSKGFKKPGGK